MLKEMEEVLTAYGIYPVEMERITDRMFRVSDQNNSYALKKSSLTKQTTANWENVYHQANAKNLTTVLPVYLTQQGRLFEEDNQIIYYLTPWIDPIGENQSIKQFYKTIGEIHAKTKHSQLISTEKAIAQFNTYKNDCEASWKTLLSYVEQFEKSRYMSPFELLVCTQYRDLENTFIAIHKRIEQLTVQLEDQSEWNLCLCHGNLDSLHIIQSNQTLLINWEKAHYENAIQDLVIFYKNTIIYYDEPIELFLEQFNHYMNENELNKCELYLLSIYLLDQKKYMSLVEAYINKTSNISMVEQIIPLQQTYRQLLFGLQFTQFIDREYDTLSFEDLES